MIYRISHAHRNKVRRLSQPVYNHPNSITTPLSPRKTYNEVHSDMLPLPLGNRQGLQQTRWPLMLGLHLLASKALRYENSHISLHTPPPKLATQILIHLSTSRMHRKARMVKLSEYFLSARLRHKQTVSVSHTQVGIHRQTLLNFPTGDLLSEGFYLKVTSLCL